MHRERHCGAGPSLTQKTAGSVRKLLQATIENGYVHTYVHIFYVHTHVYLYTNICVYIYIWTLKKGLAGRGFRLSWVAGREFMSIPDFEPIIFVYALNLRGSLKF